MEMSPEYAAVRARLHSNGPGALDELKRLAKDGDAHAQMALADMYISGKGIGRDRARGFKLITKAAAQGLGEAQLAHIYFTAKGIGRPANPVLARNMLARLAEHHRFAAVQHHLLAHATSRATLSELEPEIISDDPRIVIWRGLFSQAEYGYLRQIMAPKMAPAMVVNTATGKGRRDPIRKSHAASIMPLEEDLLVQDILATISQATASAPEQGEPLTILRYRVGDEYRSHYDAYHKGWNGPQRRQTALIWLNDDFAGGETWFNRLDIKVKGRAGDMLVFDNLDADGNRDDRMEHAGLPVTAGEKWLASRWILTEDTARLSQFG